MQPPNKHNRRNRSQASRKDKATCSEGQKQTINNVVGNPHQ
jgi:hypothetical protein